MEESHDFHVEMVLSLWEKAKKAAKKGGPTVKTYKDAVKTAEKLVQDAEITYMLKCIKETGKFPESWTRDRIQKVCRKAGYRNIWNHAAESVAREIVYDDSFSGELVKQWIENYHCDTAEQALAWIDAENGLTAVIRHWLDKQWLCITRKVVLDAHELIGDYVAGYTLHGSHKEACRDIYENHFPESRMMKHHQKVDGIWKATQIPALVSYEELIEKVEKGRDE